MSGSKKYIYSVCGHPRHSDEVPTRSRKATFGVNLLNLGQLKCCRNKLPSYIETMFMYGFCHACRGFYDFAGRANFDLQSVILNYWAFKNSEGISEPVDPGVVPASVIFSAEPTPRLQLAMDDRLELFMLFNQIACPPRAPVEETMVRLEMVRWGTLHWAARGPSPYRAGQSHILNDVQSEDTFRPRQVHEATLLALCGLETEMAADSDRARIAQIDCIPRAGENETKQRSSTTDPRLVSRWSESTNSSTQSIHSLSGFSRAYEPPEGNWI